MLDSSRIGLLAATLGLAAGLPLLTAVGGCEPSLGGGGGDDDDAADLCPADDALEENDSQQDAHDFDEFGATQSDLVLCPGDTDWYRANPTGTGIVEAELDFEPGGAPTVDLFDGSGVLLESAPGVGGLHLLDWTGTDCGGPGVGFIRVDRSDDGNEPIAYSLSLTVEDACSE